MTDRKRDQREQEQAVLEALDALGRPANGGEIAERIGRDRRHTMRILRRLQDRGVLHCVENPPGPGRKGRPVATFYRPRAVASQR